MEEVKRKYGEYRRLTGRRQQPGKSKSMQQG
jgi:hypothetical protein